MSEDLTQDLPAENFQARVLAELSAIRGDIAGIDHRLTSLEEKVDRRLQETRPIWENVQSQLRQLDTKFDLVIKDLYEIPYDQVMLARRVEQLEKTPAQ